VQVAVFAAAATTAVGCGAGAYYPAVVSGFAAGAPASRPRYPVTPAPEVPAEGISDACRQELRARLFGREAQARAGGPTQDIDQAIQNQILDCQVAFVERQRAEAAFQADQNRRLAELEESRQEAAKQREYQAALIRSANAQRAAQQEAQQEAKKEAPPPPPSDAEFKLPPIERQRRAAVRAAKQAEREKRAQEASAAEEQRAAAQAAEDDKFCGEAPKRSGWDGIWIGLERAFKAIANDPDSIEFVNCGNLLRRSRPSCWTTSCAVRGKNAFGVKILRDMTFGKAADGWRSLDR
jgi:hypothetical protein